MLKTAKFCDDFGTCSWFCIFPIWSFPPNLSNQTHFAVLLYLLCSFKLQVLRFETSPFWSPEFLGTERQISWNLNLNKTLLQRSRQSVIGLGGVAVFKRLRFVISIPKFVWYEIDVIPFFVDAWHLIPFTVGSRCIRESGLSVEERFRKWSRNRLKNRFAKMNGTNLLQTHQLVMRLLASFWDISSESKYDRNLIFRPRQKAYCQKGWQDQKPKAWWQ